VKRIFIFILPMLVSSFAWAQTSAATARDACRMDFPARQPHQLRSGAATTLSFTIATDGNVKDVTVVDSSGDADLDDAAAKCASTWHYKPAVQDGKAVEVPWKAKVLWTAR